MSLELEMASPQEALVSSDRRLVDMVDSLLDHGVMIRAELWLSVADIDLIYLGADLVLASSNAMALPIPVPPPVTKALFPESNVGEKQFTGPVMEISQNKRTTW